MTDSPYGKHVSTSNLRQEEDGYLAIKRYDDNTFTLTNNSIHTGTIALFKNNIFLDILPPEFSNIDENTIEVWLSFSPELILIGTGNTHLFLPPKLISMCYAQHVGVETMKTDAAARTLRILAGEMRSVLSIFYC